MGDYSDYDEKSDDSEYNNSDEDTDIEQTQLDDDGLLTNYSDILNLLFQTNQIDDNTFEHEKLMIDYKNALSHKKFELSDIDTERIAKINSSKKQLEDEYVQDKIDEVDYNRKYYNLIKFELSILNENEAYSKKSIKIESVLPETFEKKIDELEKSEEQHLRDIANKYNIIWPEKPKNKIANYIKTHEDYKLQLHKAQEEAKKYIPGYKRAELSVDNLNYVEWKMVDPVNFKLLNLKKREDTNINLIMDPSYELTIKTLREKLKTNSREQLLDCIDNSDINIRKQFSYIENLKNNSIPVMKFREYPESYDKLKEILSEEAKYYKVPLKLITKDFTSSFFEPDPLEQVSGIFTQVKTVKIGELKLPVEGNFLLKIKEIPKKEKYSKYKKYTEKGSVASISFKKEYFKKDINTVEIDEKYYDIIKPLSDDLYIQLKNENLPGNKTDLVKVWELHVYTSGVSVKLIRRYSNFENYLSDLLIILTQNMIKLEKSDYLKSADILYIKIQKIKNYLETGKDPEETIEGKYSVSDLINNNKYIKEQRKSGINTLREYILDFYPENNELIETLENDIFNYSNTDYLQNIYRIIFIFKEYSDSLKNYISGTLSFIYLINIEIPFIIPKNDLEEYYTNPEKTLDYIKSWNPKIDKYLIYKDYLLSIDDNILQFKKDKIDLSELEVNEIFEQMLEYKQWNKSLLECHNVIIPYGKNPTRVKLEFLKTHRNRLPSRIIFRVADISLRVETRASLYQIFNKCNLNKNSIKEVVDITESIIYSYSKRPNDYKKYTNLIKMSYTSLCDLITDYKNIIPTITEFIIKEGDMELINIERLGSIILKEENMNELLSKYLNKFRFSELEMYKTALLEQQNKEQLNYRKILINAINLVILKIKNDKKDKMYSIADNSYICPVLTNIIPKIINGNTFYTPDYIVIGINEYIYGGNFPSFYSNIDFDDFGEPVRNYTDDDIYSLATTLKIDYTESIKVYSLYKECMDKIQKYSDDNTEKIYKQKSILEYNTKLSQTKQYLSFVNYIYRERLGVKSPGDIYIVYKDTFSREYAVPFKYTDNYIPIYNSKFKELSQYYYIEGPAIFEDSDMTTFIHSTMYIFVEYNDTINKVKIFREGVNSKFIKRSAKDLFDPCNRFNNEIDCNDINSYSINKIKCKYIKNKCVQSDLLDISEKTNIDISIDTIEFKKYNDKIDYSKTKRWEIAKKQANDYISRLSFIRKLNISDVKLLALEQKQQLLNYSEKLKKMKHFTKMTPISENVNYSNNKKYYDVHPIIKELKESEEKELKEKELKEKESELKDSELKDSELKDSELKEQNYKTIRLPRITISHKRVSSRQLIKGKKYLLSNDNMFIYDSQDLDYIYSLDSKIKKDSETIREFYTSEIVEYITFTISNDNYNFLNNPPKIFYYYLLKSEYTFKNSEIITKKFKIKESVIPKINLMNEYLNSGNNDNIITKQIIYSTMAELSYSTWIESETGIFESMEEFPASKDAKVYSLQYSVDLNNLITKIVGKIDLQNVMDEYNQILPTVMLKENYIKLQLQYGIEHNDYKLLNKFIKEASKINYEKFKDLIEKADELILNKQNDSSLNKTQSTPTPTPTPTVTPTTEEKKVSVSYVVTRRRR